MEKHELAEALEPVANQAVKWFLNAQDHARAEPAVYDAFWTLIYWNVPKIDHSEVVALEAELMECERKVSDVVEGWRPDRIIPFVVEPKS